MHDAGVGLEGGREILWCDPVTGITVGEQCLKQCGGVLADGILCVRRARMSNRGPKKVGSSAPGRAAHGRGCLAPCGKGEDRCVVATLGELLDSMEEWLMLTT